MVLVVVLVVVVVVELDMQHTPPLPFQEQWFNIYNISSPSLSGALVPWVVYSDLAVRLV